MLDVRGGPKGPPLCVVVLTELVPRWSPCVLPSVKASIAEMVPLNDAWRLG